MGFPVRRRAGSNANAVQRALVIVLLTLTGVLGVAAGQPPAPAASMTLAPAAEPVTRPGDEAVVPTDDAGSHAHDAISLLCLCALVVAGVLLATRRGIPHWQRRHVRNAAGPARTMRVFPPMTLTDPLSWGVCRR